MSHRDHYSPTEPPEIADRFVHPAHRDRDEEDELTGDVTPPEPYRCASLRLIHAINKTLIFIADAKNKRLAVWQAAHAMSLPMCKEVTMALRSSRMGISRSAFSRGYKNFSRGAQLPTGTKTASLRFVHILNKALIYIADSQDKRLAVWQVAYAMGLPMCEGITMTARSSRMGLTRAAFSKGSKEFLRGAQLPPSEYMKSAEATGAYAAARTLQLS